MFDEQAVLTMIARSSQDECREIGNLFLSLVDQPRDLHWEAQFRRRLEQFPAPPASSLAIAISKGRARVDVLQHDLWKRGWHPIQMREKLVELGYAGLDDDAASPVPVYELQRYSAQDGPWSE